MLVDRVCCVEDQSSCTFTQEGKLGQGSSLIPSIGELASSQIAREYKPDVHHVILRQGSNLTAIMWYSGKAHTWQPSCDTQARIKLDSQHVILRQGSNLMAIMWYSIKAQTWQPSCDTQARSNLTAIMWYSSKAQTCQPSCDNQARLKLDGHHVIIKQGSNLMATMWYSSKAQIWQPSCDTQARLKLDGHHMILKQGSNKHPPQYLPNIPLLKYKSVKLFNCELHSDRHI